MLVLIGSFESSRASDNQYIKDKALFKRIQCNRESNTPAGGGLGSLWGCFSQNEEAKLWINGVASGNTRVQSINFSAIKYHSRKIDVTGRIWSGIVAEEFGKDKAPEMKTIFKSCPSNKTFDFSDRETTVKCSKGPKADEHLIIVFPK